MEALDLGLRDQKFQSSLLIQHDLPRNLEQKFVDVVLGLGFGRTECLDIPPPTQHRKLAYDLTECLTSLVGQSNLSDVVGARMLSGDSVLHYSTFVLSQLKPHLPVYGKLLEEISIKTGIPVVVWLEDLMSLPRFKWSFQAVQDATAFTRGWFESQGFEIIVMVGSESGAGIVPLDFVMRTFSGCGMGELMILLPFHKHDISIMTVGDVAHCLWSTYVFSRFPGLHLTAINSKRNYLLFRKLCGKRYSVALLPRVL